jgi:hypothetical protein
VRIYRITERNPRHQCRVEIRNIWPPLATEGDAIIAALMS